MVGLNIPLRVLDINAMLFSSSRWYPNSPILHQGTNTERICHRSKCACEKWYTRACVPPPCRHEKILLLLFFRHLIIVPTLAFRRLFIVAVLLGLGIGMGGRGIVFNLFLDHGGRVGNWFIEAWIVHLRGGWACDTC